MTQFVSNILFGSDIDMGWFIPDIIGLYTFDTCVVDFFFSVIISHILLKKGLEF